MPSDKGSFITLSIYKALHHLTVYKEQHEPNHRALGLPSLLTVLFFLSPQEPWNQRALFSLVWMFSSRSSVTCKYSTSMRWHRRPSAYSR